MTPTDTPKADQPEPGEAAMEAAAKMKQGIANLSKHWAAAIIQAAINAAVKPVEAERDALVRDVRNVYAEMVQTAWRERDAARAAAREIMRFAGHSNVCGLRKSGCSCGMEATLTKHAALLAEPDLSKGEGGG